MEVDLPVALHEKGLTPSVAHPVIIDAVLHDRLLPQILVTPCTMAPKDAIIVGTSTREVQRDSTAERLLVTKRASIVRADQDCLTGRGRLVQL
jgi:hypothetical protein